MRSDRNQRRTKDRTGSTGIPAAAAGKEAHYSLKSFDLETTENLTEPTGLDDSQALLNWGLSALSSSPTARRMIQEAAQEGWCLGLADLGAVDFHLDVPERVILLDCNGLDIAAIARSSYFRNMMLISLSRALRDVWQEKRYGGFDEDYAPQDILMLERVRAADGDVVTVLVGWEMRGAGMPELWRTMLGSEDGDIALAFSSYLEKEPSALFNGLALVAAFNQWYRAPARVNACDHEALEMMDGILETQEGGNPFGNKKLGRVALEVLSCLPDKTAYLQNYGHNILTDPLYAGLCDPINQSYLMQILHDMQAVYKGGIAFRDNALASKIFPEDMPADLVESDLF